MFAEEIDTDDGSSSLSNQLRYTDKGGHSSEEKRTSSNYRRFVQSYRRDLGVHRGAAAGTVAGKTQGIETFTQYRVDDGDVIETQTTNKPSGQHITSQDITVQHGQQNYGQHINGQHITGQHINGQHISGNDSLHSNNTDRDFADKAAQDNHNVTSTSCDHEVTHLNKMTSYDDSIVSQNKTILCDSEQGDTEAAYDYMCYMGNRVPSKSFGKLLQSMANDGTPNTRAFRDCTSRTKPNNGLYGNINTALNGRAAHKQT